jgi:hypothetical protein
LICNEKIFIRQPFRQPQIGFRQPN